MKLWATSIAKEPPPPTSALTRRELIMNQDSPHLSTQAQQGINEAQNYQPLAVTMAQGPAGPGLAVGGIHLHSSTTPWEEATSWVNSAFKSHQGQKPGLALVFGVGLGYHLKVLRKKYPNIRLAVFEPMAEMISVYSNVQPLTTNEGEAPFITSNWEAFEKAVSQQIGQSQASGVLVLTPPPYQSLKPEDFQIFDQYVRQQIIRRAVIDRTRESTGHIFLSNLAKNANILPDLPDLMALKGKLGSIGPAFIVGSAPSLDSNISHLKEAMGKGMILASSSALKPLLKQGVRPDVVLVLESEDTSDYLRLTSDEMAILGDNTVLALASSCHPAHFQVPGFHKGIFHLSSGEAQLFGNGVFLPQGGNSGTAAFSLAYCWGLNPLILVGQDQAYQGNRLHAQGTPGEVNDPNFGLLNVMGIGGREVQTDTGLLASIAWYAEAVKTIATLPNPPALFNASASGARLAGFREVPLEAISASLPLLAKKLNAASILPHISKNSREEIKSDMTQLAGIVNTLRRMGRTDAKKAYAEMKQFCEMSKFLRQLLNTALATPNPQAFKASCERADELMTQMLSNFS